MDPRSDSELLETAPIDGRAFEELYRRHSVAVTKFAARRARSPQDVIDLVGAIWLEVVASVDRFESSRGEPLPWILGIATNLCAADRRRLQRERELVERLGGRRPIAEDDFDRLEEEIDAAAAARRLVQALTSLPAGERVVAELVFVEDLTPSEVAQALGIRAPTVRMRLTRARRRLRALAIEHDALPITPRKEVVR